MGGFSTIPQGMELFFSTGDVACFLRPAAISQLFSRQLDIFSFSVVSLQKPGTKALMNGLKPEGHFSMSCCGHMEPGQLTHEAKLRVKD